MRMIRVIVSVRSSSWRESEITKLIKVIRVIRVISVIRVITGY